MIILEKEKIMREMLDVIKINKQYYKEISDRDLAIINLGELHAFDIYFNIVDKMGESNDETIKISNEFKKDLDDSTKLLIEKSGRII